MLVATYIICDGKLFNIIIIISDHIEFLLFNYVHVQK